MELEAGDIEVLMRLQERWAGRAEEGDRNAARVWWAVTELLEEATVLEDARAAAGREPG